MKRLYSTAATLVLAGALVLPTATTAQAADSDLTVSVTLSVYNKGSVGHALEVYDRTKQIDEGKCKSFSNGNNDYRIEFAQGDNFTRCSIFPPFEGPENAGKYYSLDDKGEFIFVYSSEQLMQETEFLGRPRDIGYISIRPLVFDLDSASAGAKFTDYWANRRDDSKYTPVEQIVLWNKPDGKVAVHGKKTDAYQGNATVAAQYSTPVPSFEPLTPAPTDPAAPDRNRTASASKSGSLLGSISSTTWIIAAAVAGGLVVLAGIVFFVLRGRSRKADTPAKSQRQQAREEARAAKRQAREDRKRETSEKDERSKREKRGKAGKRDKAKRDKRAKAAKRAAAESESEIHAWTDGIPLSPVWWAPVFTTLMIVGLLWIVVFYISSAAYPIPQLGQWNLAVGGGIAFIGFLMTMRWR